jgi:hypothetical protein
MTGFICFEGRIETVNWGRATYTILPLPQPVVEALGKTRRVEGEINAHPVNLAMTRAPVVEGVFLWAGQLLLARIGISPGEPLEVRLRPAADDQVDLPQDVSAALVAAGVTAAWDTLTPGKQRGLLYPINAAKTEATRAKRIRNLIALLSA